MSGSDGSRAICKSIPERSIEAGTERAPDAHHTDSILTIFAGLRMKILGDHETEGGKR